MSIFIIFFYELTPYSDPCGGLLIRSTKQGVIEFAICFSVLFWHKNSVQLTPLQKEKERGENHKICHNHEFMMA